MDFQIKDAKPLKVEIKNFYPNPRQDEARELLLRALDWKEQKDQKEKINKSNKEKLEDSPKIVTKSKEYKKVIIENPSEEILPPCIKSILKGIKQDGRKRALFILINFFKFLGVPDSKIEERINKWNEKNYMPLKKGYIISQLSWYRKNTPRMPPNYSNPVYKDLAILSPEEVKFKNPVNYAIKRYFALMK